MALGGTVPYTGFNKTSFGYGATEVSGTYSSLTNAKVTIQPHGGTHWDDTGHLSTTGSGSAVPTYDKLNKIWSVEGPIADVDAVLAALNFFPPDYPLIRGWEATKTKTNVTTGSYINENPEDTVAIPDTTFTVTVYDPDSSYAQSGSVNVIFDAVQPTFGKIRPYWSIAPLLEDVGTDGYQNLGMGTILQGSDTDPLKVICEFRNYGLETVNPSNSFGQFIDTSHIFVGDKKSAPTDLVNNRLNFTGSLAEVQSYLDNMKYSRLANRTTFDMFFTLSNGVVGSTVTKTCWNSDSVVGLTAITPQSYVEDVVATFDFGALTTTNVQPDVTNYTAKITLDSVGVGGVASFDIGTGHAPTTTWNGTLLTVTSTNESLMLAAIRDLVFTTVADFNLSFDMSVILEYTNPTIGSTYSSVAQVITVTGLEQKEISNPETYHIYTEDMSYNFSSGTVPQIVHPYNETFDVIFNIGTATGSLNKTGTATTLSHTGSGTYTMSGTRNNVNTDLATLYYSPAVDYNLPHTINFTVDRTSGTNMSGDPLETGWFKMTGIATGEVTASQLINVAWDEDVSTTFNSGLIITDTSTEDPLLESYESLYTVRVELFPNDGSGGAYTDGNIISNTLGTMVPTGTGHGHDSYIMNGTKDEINAALSNMKFIPNPNHDGGGPWVWYKIERDYKNLTFNAETYGYNPDFVTKFLDASNTEDYSVTPLTGVDWEENVTSYFDSGLVITDTVTENSDYVDPTITSGAFVVGNVYTILSVNTTMSTTSSILDTDFTLIGSADNVVGTTFTATGVGGGTGTATHITGTDHFFNTEYKTILWMTTPTTLAAYTNGALHTSATMTTVPTGTGRNTTGDEFVIIGSRAEINSALANMKFIPNIDYYGVGPIINYHTTREYDSTIIQNFGSDTESTFNTNTATTNIESTSQPSIDWNEDVVTDFDNGLIITDKATENPDHSYYKDTTFTVEARAKFWKTKTAGSFAIGVYTVILTLGDTDWNVAAGTTGITYSVGSNFNSVVVGSGTGTAHQPTAMTNAIWTTTIPTDELSSYALITGVGTSADPLTVTGTKSDVNIVISNLRMVGDTDWITPQPSTVPQFWFEWKVTRDIDNIVYLNYGSSSITFNAGTTTVPYIETVSPVMTYIEDTPKNIFSGTDAGITETSSDYNPLVSYGVEIEISPSSAGIWASTETSTYISPVSTVGSINAEIQTLEFMPALDASSPFSLLYKQTRYVSGTKTAGSFVVGKAYTIETVGTTVFTDIGSANNTIGTIFTATGVGAGTGTANNETTFQADGTVNIATVTGTAVSPYNISVSGLTSYDEDSVTSIFSGTDAGITETALSVTSGVTYTVAVEISPSSAGTWYGTSLSTITIGPDTKEKVNTDIQSLQFLPTLDSLATVTIKYSQTRHIDGVDVIQATAETVGTLSGVNVPDFSYGTANSNIQYFVPDSSLQGLNLELFNQSFNKLMPGGVKHYQYEHTDQIGAYIPATNDYPSTLHAVAMDTWNYQKEHIDILRTVTPTYSDYLQAAPPNWGRDNGPLYDVNVDYETLKNDRWFDSSSTYNFNPNPNPNVTLTPKQLTLNQGLLYSRPITITDPTVNAQFKVTFAGGTLLTTVGASLSVMDTGWGSKEDIHAMLDSGLYVTGINDTNDNQQIHRSTHTANFTLHKRTSTGVENQIAQGQLNYYFLTGMTLHKFNDTTKTVTRIDNTPDGETVTMNVDRQTVGNLASGWNRKGDLGVWDDPNWPNGDQLHIKQSDNSQWQNLNIKGEPPTTGDKIFISFWNNYLNLWTDATRLHNDLKTDTLSTRHFHADANNYGNAYYWISDANSIPGSSPGIEPRLAGSETGREFVIHALNNDETKEISTHLPKPRSSADVHSWTPPRKYNAVAQHSKFLPWARKPYTPYYNQQINNYQGIAVFAWTEWGAKLVSGQIASASEYHWYEQTIGSGEGWKKIYDSDLPPVEYVPTSGTLGTHNRPPLEAYGGIMSNTSESVAGAPTEVGSYWVKLPDHIPAHSHLGSELKGVFTQSPNGHAIFLETWGNGDLNFETHYPNDSLTESPGGGRHEYGTSPDGRHLMMNRANQIGRRIRIKVGVVNEQSDYNLQLKSNNAV